MEEAEAATAQLDAAFKATGQTVGLARSHLDRLASSLQETTKFSDDLVKEGEAILLTFTKVRGEAFERTIKVAADLSSRLGTDLKSSIKQVGLALQDPVAGLNLLRRSGVAFSDEQKNQIQRFIETNQAAKAQNLILGELEKRFKGSAVAARSTLGGALAGLKNSFSDLFEGSRESSKAAAEAINELTKALQDPEVKKGLDTLIEGSAKIAANFIKAAAAQVQVFKEGFGLSDLGDQFTRGGGPRRGGIRGSSPEADAAIQELDEVRVTVKKIVDDNDDLMRELADSTKTAVQKTAGEYTKLKTTLQFLNDQQLITSREKRERLGAALDELLPEFDLNEIRSKYIHLKKETTELGEFMKGVWQEVGRSIQSTLSDAIYNWNLSWRSLIDIARRALADITSAILTSGIKDGLAGLFGTGDQSALADSFFAFLGSKAGGGRFDGATMVGEDGPELLMGSGNVMNKRQMAFAGMGGANINYAPTFNLNIESSGDRDTEARMAAFVDTRIAQSQQEFARTLKRSGVEVRG